MMLRKVSLLLVLVMVLLTAAAIAEDANTCTYTVYNATGEKVTELYLIDNKTGEKGENLAGEGVENGAAVELSKTAEEGKTGKEDFELSLTFKTESGYEGTFGTLHFETVPITLLAQDALTGATPISFSAPDTTCTYTVYNKTGEKVTELFLMDNKTGEKGENLAGEGVEKDASVELSRTVKADKTGKEDYELSLIFKTESGYEGTFGTLHFETVPITLLAQDALTGATPISFSAPDATCTYTVYNVTGEKVTELYLIDNKTGEKGENLAGEGIEKDAAVELSRTVKADKTGKEDYELTLSFKTESGYEGSFGTLHFETVPISLLAQDALTGATQISFQAPAK